jgi:hypothetical protein
MPNASEYYRPTPYSLDNGVRVSNGVMFGDRSPLIKTRTAQKRKGHLKVTVIRDGEAIDQKRISKATACVIHGLWNRKPIKARK